MAPHLHLRVAPGDDGAVRAGDHHAIAREERPDGGGVTVCNGAIEGGAAGISMTNFDRNGRLSICKGNIVRNLAKGSLTNPGVVPYGIAAEADAAIVGNIVEAVPGTSTSRR